MLILKTITHETIWGGEKLIPYSDGSTKKVGHLYSLVSNGEMESVILNGEYKGQTFKSFFEQNKSKFNLDNYAEFPFVIAIVEAKDDLSIQVHPDDIVAKKIENRPLGKNESWYFIEAPTSGLLYNGCKCTSLKELKEKINTSRINEALDYLPVKKGEYVYVEAGTLHAMSAGSLVYEIEENCNLTYRFFDFNRKDSTGKGRELHLDKALKAINVALKSEVKTYNNGEINERLYSTKLFDNSDKYKNTSNTLECLTILKGIINWDGNSLQLGTTIVLEPNEEIPTDNVKFLVARPQTKGGL